MNNLDQETLKKLQALELKCLLEFDRICKAHDIRYFLGGGTLLGAIRHQGFIPWDDDVDVMMTVEEHDKFVRIVNSEIGDEFIYQSMQNDPEFYNTFDKIRLKNTIYDTFLTQKFDLLSHGIFIDIFTHDHISRYHFMQKIHIFRTVLAKSFVLHKCKNIPMSFYGRMKFACRLATIYKDHVPLDRLKKKAFKIVTKYDKKDTGILYDGRGEHTKHGVFPEWILTDGSVQVLFNGYYFPAPKHYDEYLKFSYGENYMELPPSEKRVPGHELAELDFGPYGAQ